jgi:hypothetical protein
MSLQLFHKVVESAAPGLAEMFVRGQSAQFTRRYWDIIFLTLATSSVGAVAIAAGNSAFISLWTGGKVTWSVQGDIILGLMVLTTSLSRSFISVFGVTKNLRPVRIIYFIEGIAFVPFAIFAAKWYGLEGVLTASLISHIVITLISSAKAASKVIGSLKPLIPAFVFSLVVVTSASVSSFVTSTLEISHVSRFATTALPVFVATVSAWFIVLPNDLRSRFLTLFKSNIPRLRKSE